MLPAKSCLRKAPPIKFQGIHGLKFRKDLADSAEKLLSDSVDADSMTKGKGGLGWVGLEPTTNALKGRCSTIELPTRRGEKS